jgi:hypothetical protein
MEPDSPDKFVLRKSSAFSCYRTVFLGQAPRIAAPAFSPAMERTGIVNFVFAISAKSFAVSGQAAK